MSCAKLKSAGIVLSVAAGVVISGVGVRAVQSQGEQGIAQRAAAPAAPKGKTTTEKPASQPAAGAPGATLSAQDVLRAEASTFERLLGAYRPGSLSGVMNLHEWSERVLRADLDAIQDPALRTAALAAHAQRMETLAQQEDQFAKEHPENDSSAAVARTFATTARYRLTSAPASPAPTGMMSQAMGGMMGGGLGMLSGGMGMIGGGMAGAAEDERFAGRTPHEARLLERVIAQAEARREIAASSARIKESNPANQSILKKLDAPVSMSFARETPLEDVLKYIKSATQGAADSGIPVYIDPDGLALAEKTMQSPIIMDLEGVPLKITLRLLLRQLGLAYCVKDGLLMISTPEIILEELKEVEQLMEENGAKQ